MPSLSPCKLGSRDQIHHSSPCRQSHKFCSDFPNLSYIYLYIFSQVNLSNTMQLFKKYFFISIMCQALYSRCGRPDSINYHWHLLNVYFDKDIEALNLLKNLCSHNNTFSFSRWRNWRYLSWWEQRRHQFNPSLSEFNILTCNLIFEFLRHKKPIVYVCMYYYKWLVL